MTTCVLPAVVGDLFLLVLSRELFSLKAEYLIHGRARDNDGRGGPDSPTQFAWGGSRRRGDTTSLRVFGVCVFSSVSSVSVCSDVDFFPQLRQRILP